MDEQSSQAWDRNEALIKRLARIDYLENKQSFPKGCANLTVSGVCFGLPLTDILDIDEERARLRNSLDRLDKEKDGLCGRLNNPKFVASAPKDIVNETRAKLDLLQEEEVQMIAAVERLEDLA